MAPHPIPLLCALALPPISHGESLHAQSLLGPSFHDPRTPHVFEFHPEQAAPLSRRAARERERERERESERESERQREGQRERERERERERDLF